MLILIPYFGRRVMLGTGTTLCPGTMRKRNLCEIAASSNVASIIAKDAPTQERGPPPNGKYAERGRRCVCSSNQRPGSNCSGVGKNRCSRRVIHWVIQEFEPA